MLNQIILVGRISQLPQDNAMTLAVSRSYKNTETNMYETDFIPVNVPKTLLQNVLDYTRVGDIVGVKGRLETRDNELVVIADRITFLSSSNTNNTTNNDTNNDTNNLGEGEI